MSIKFWHVGEFSVRSVENDIEELEIYHPNGTDLSVYTGTTASPKNSNYIKVLLDGDWSPEAATFLEQVKFYEQPSDKHPEYGRNPLTDKHDTYLKGVWAGNVDSKFGEWNLVSYEIHLLRFEEGNKKVFKSRIDWLKIGSSGGIKAGGSGSTGWTWPD